MSKNIVFQHTFAHESRYFVKYQIKISMLIFQRLCRKLLPHGILIAIYYSMHLYARQVKFSKKGSILPPFLIYLYLKYLTAERKSPIS